MNMAQRVNGQYYLFVIRLGEINVIGLNIKTSNFVFPLQTTFRCPNL